MKKLSTSTHHKVAFHLDCAYYILNATIESKPEEGLLEALLEIRRSMDAIANAIHEDKE